MMSRVKMIGIAGLAATLAIAGLARAESFTPIASAAARRNHCGVLHGHIRPGQLERMALSPGQCLGRGG